MLINLGNFSKKTSLIYFIFCMFCMVFSLNSMSEEFKKNPAAGSEKEKGKTATNKTDYDSVIKEYKEFVKGTKPEIRDEIKKYREKVAEFNRQKSNLYKELSQEAQAYLKKERTIRYKIPIEDRREYIKKFYSEN